MTRTFTSTSEAVSIGHPDALCDQVADSVLDYMRTVKRNAQSAVEVAASANKIFLFGEIDADVVYDQNKYSHVDISTRNVADANLGLAQDIISTVRSTIRNIGYDADLYYPEIVFDISTQSAEINAAVEGNDDKEPGAGDQGIVTGYAVAETSNFQSLHFMLAHRILQRLEDARLSGERPELLPDAKSQVTVRYADIDTGNGEFVPKPVAVEHILLSHSHSPGTYFEQFRDEMNQLVKDICEEYLREGHHELYTDTLIESLKSATVLINPAGSWTTPGPAYDSGLSGRKLVVNNYGSAAPIGGGSSAGKCLNKVDRSGAYFARHIAKSVVSSGLARECLVEIGFAIGVPQPTALNIKTFGTEKVSVDEIRARVEKAFDFSVKNIIATSASVDSFVRTSQHGNYTDNTFPWEQVVDLSR